MEWGESRRGLGLTHPCGIWSFRPNRRGVNGKMDNQMSSLVIKKDGLEQDLMPFVYVASKILPNFVPFVNSSNTVVIVYQ